MLHFLKAKIYQMNKIKSPKMAKIGRFITSRFSKIDFMQNLSDRKIMKFPHCVVRLF